MPRKAGSKTVTKVIKSADSVESKPKKNRRSPYDLLQDLKAKRQALAEKTEKKLAQYDSKIQLLETRYQRKIQIEELRAGMTPEELEQQFEQLKEQQRLLKLAMKQRTSK